MTDAMLYYEKKEEIWDPLVSSDSDIFVFKSYKDLFVFAVCVGYVNDKRKPLSNNKKQGEIRWEYLTRENKMVIDSVALSESSDPRLLIDSNQDYLDKKVKIAEEYANGGIDILKTELLEKPGSPLENLVSYMNKVSKLEEKEGFLKKIEDEF